jgi:MFS family permease
VVWVFYFLSFVASFALLPTAPLHLRELGMGVRESGGFTAAFMLGSGLGALFTGPMGDRWGQASVLKWATLASAACFAAYSLLAGTWAFFLVGVPHGVIWSGFRTATLAWVGGFLPEERRADGLAFFGMAAPGGAALGPALGVWLMPHVGFPQMMLLLAALSASLFFIVGLLPLAKAAPGPQLGPLATPEPQLGPLATPEPQLGELALPHQPLGAGRAPAQPAPDRAASRFGWILAPAAVLACLALSYGSIPSYGTQEAADNHFLWPSALVSCYGVGMVLLRLFMGWRGMGRDPLRLMPSMLALNIAAAFGLAVVPGGLVRHILCGTLYGASFGMAHTLVWTYTMGRVDAHRRGTATGALYFSYDVGIALGSFLVGFPMEHLGYRWGWAACAIPLCAAWPAGRRVAKG